MNYLVEYMVDSVGVAVAIVEAESAESAVRAVQASQPGYDVEALRVKESSIFTPTIVVEPVVVEGENPEDPAQGTASGDS